MSTQYITSIGLFYKNVGVLLGGLSDCVFRLNSIFKIHYEAGS